MTNSFEPYLEPSKLTPDDIAKTHAAIVAFDVARDVFKADPSAENLVVWLNTHGEMVQAAEAADSACTVMPVMVHIAGEPKHEQSSCGHEDCAGMVQRCSSCGSDLMEQPPEGAVFFGPNGPEPFDADNWSWFPVGARIAKAVSGDESSGAVFTLDKRPEPNTPQDLRALEAHEYPCIGNAIFGENHGTTES